MKKKFAFALAFISCTKIFWNGMKKNMNKKNKKGDNYTRNIFYDKKIC